MKTITIVEDERNICIALEVALSAAGYRVTSFQDPVEALPQVTADPPDVLILNGHMPGMHGIEFFLRYRATTTMPVVFISASADEIEDQLTQRGCPAEAYVAKPLSQRELLQVVRQLQPT